MREFKALATVLLVGLLAIIFWTVRQHSFAIRRLEQQHKADAAPRQRSEDATSAPAGHGGPIIHAPAVSAPAPQQGRSRRLFTVTAYDPGACCTGKWADGVTASGVPAIGKIVAAPKEYPFGTRMHVPGYGWATVQDRGGSIKGARLDCLFATHQEALNFGRQELMVTIEKGQ